MPLAVAPTTPPIRSLRARSALILLLFATAFLPGRLLPAEPGAHGPIVRFDIDGPIGPAARDFAVRSLALAEGRDARLVVIRLDTPGGLDTAMRAIVKKILASPVPVATFVAPSGARAASAGTYILYASPIAAMAPGTNLGAATPVKLGEAEAPPGKDPPEAPEKPHDPHAQKMVNDAVAYLRGLAMLRGRNADWAERAVREAASLPADEALTLKVIDLVATDVPDLIHKLQGRRVTVLGRELTLDLTGAPVETLAPDWRIRLLAVITDPNIAYILLLIGLYGLILEFSHPGAVVPGTVGAICLLLALYAFQLLPVNYAGLGLLLLGIALMVAEAFVPSFGVLGIGGVAAFAIGSLLLTDQDGAPGFAIDPALIAALALISLLFFGLAMGFIVRARRRPVVTGREELSGAVGVALEDFTATGRIRVRGEIWNARSARPVRRGQQVRIENLDGLTLLVEPIPPSREPP
ncbi:NfeD family protein [Candidatus Methylocalor cossyra]|uniref:Membrane-bound ClpP-class protease associated with aq_911 n=1 Tax=Candidatus Methylocalor cossyra TaxID=3108543 RepID=A0ABP1C8M0_9GAMM